MEASVMKRIVSQEMFDCVPEINYATGCRFFLGNMENYISALLSILKSIKSKLPILQTMILSEEYTGLRSITQTLRKMMGNIGAMDLPEEAYQIELALLNEDLLYLQEQLPVYAMNLVEFIDHIELLFKAIDIKDVVTKQDDQASFKNYDFTKTKESIKLSYHLLERKIL